MKVLKTIWDNLEKFIAQVSFVFILIILFCQTVARYAFHVSATWPEEVSTYVLVWLTYVTASYAVKENAHLRIDSVMSVYPMKARKFVELLGTICWLAVAVILTYYGFIYTANQFGIGSRAIALPWLPMWLVYLGIPVGHLLLTIRLITSIVQQIINIARGKGDITAIQVTSTEVDEDMGGNAE